MAEALHLLDDAEDGLDRGLALSVAGLAGAGAQPMGIGLGRRHLTLGGGRVVGEPLSQGRIVPLAPGGDIGFDAGGLTVIAVRFAVIAGVGEQGFDRAEDRG